EQIDGKPLDGRSDIFSLGVILYELLTRNRPFEGETISQILKKILFDNPEPVLKFDSSIPEQISKIVMKALEKDPNDRFQTAEEFALALKNYKDFRLSKNKEKKPQLPQPPPKIEKTKYSVDWKIVSIAGASGGIFTLLLIFGLQYFLSVDSNPFSFKKPANEEILPTPIEVKTDPPGAVLYFDGKKVQIPIISPNDKGKHKIVAKKGCLSAEVKVSSKTESPLFLKLSPNPFQFKIDSDPQGAKILINGEETDFRTPALIPRADCDKFTIGLQLEGYSTVSREISPNETESIFLSLSPKSLEGKLKLSSASNSMKFYLNGKFLGNNGDVITLLEGEHTLRIVDEKLLGERETTVRINPKETTEIFAEDFKAGKIFIFGRPEEDGSVYVDGKLFGELPITGDKSLAVGKHKINVVSSKGKKVSFEWKIKEGEQKKVVDFEKRKVSDF
ncbi:MAG: PEGA domain-containing protein, partial [Thermoanaerobaculaceae bacterium]|nr:PEGA domain-containing protein [Thermoanaerobaculaceae bacterium]